MESLVNWVFVLVTGAVAYHGLTYRNPDGERDLVRTTPAIARAAKGQLNATPPRSVPQGMMTARYPLNS